VKDLMDKGILKPMNQEDEVQIMNWLTCKTAAATTLITAVLIV